LLVYIHGNVDVGVFVLTPASPARTVKKASVPPQTDTPPGGGGEEEDADNLTDDNTDTTGGYVFLVYV
jgi:hypothetical protein